MKEVHFYSGKIKSLIMLIVSSIFTVGLYHIGFKNDSLFLMMILYLAFVLFLFGIVYSLLLLFRTKPLLTVTGQQMIIYNVLRKPTTINFDDVLLFSTSDMKHHGIKTTEFIHIVLKHPKKNSNLLNNISPRLFGNSESREYSFQIDMINVKTKVLLDLLQSKIKPYSLLNK